MLRCKLLHISLHANIAFTLLHYTTLYTFLYFNVYLCSWFPFHCGLCLHFTWPTLYSWYVYLVGLSSYVVQGGEYVIYPWLPLSTCTLYYTVVQLRVRNPCNRDPLVVSSVMSPIPITFEPFVSNFRLTYFRSLWQKAILVRVPTCVWRDRFRPNFMNWCIPE